MCRSHRQSRRTEALAPLAAQSIGAQPQASPSPTTAYQDMKRVVLKSTDITTRKTERAASLDKFTPPSYETAMQGTGPHDKFKSGENNLTIMYTSVQGENPFNKEGAIPEVINSNQIPTNANAECAAQGHIPKKRYGAVGIVAGIVFFPWGLFWTACDSRIECRRCGEILSSNHCRQKGRYDQYYRVEDSRLSSNGCNEYGYRRCGGRGRKSKTLGYGTVDCGKCGGVGCGRCEGGMKGVGYGSYGSHAGGIP